MRGVHRKGMIRDIEMWGPFERTELSFTCKPKSPSQPTKVLMARNSFESAFKN